MFDYLEDVIFEAADDLKNSRSYYPGNNQLFKVDHDSPRLSQKEADKSIVMLRDYCLQARELGPTYKFVVHLYAHE